MYMYIIAQIQKEEIIPNSLNQITIRSKILTFNLLSLNRNFACGLNFSDRDSSMNTPPSTTTQIPVFEKILSVKSTREEGFQIVFFK